MDMAVMDIIEKRKSVRTYETTPIGENVHAAIMDYLRQEENLRGPFGGTAGIEWVWAKGGGEDSKAIRLGAYGVIQNPQVYLVGVVTNDQKALLEFGYIFHKLILYATGLGLGTCWIGGTFNRRSFTRELAPKPGEIIPCITPLGYPREKQRLLDATMRYVVKADQKKPWRDLYYDASFEHLLAPEDAGSLAAALEMVRLGPSASNKQPWRAVLSADRQEIHFYLQHTPNYSGNKLGFEMQRIDIGIAACNFELACKELGIPGVWTMRDPQLGVIDQHTEYMLSYKIS